MDKETEKNVTKVTTPIVYGLSDTVESLKKARANVSPENIDLINKLDKALDPCVRACTINYFVDTLIRHSAQKIYIIDQGGNLDKEVISGVPKFLKRRIEWVDRNKKILKLIDEMTLPVYNELETAWEKKREQSGIEASNILGHEHGLCIINEFLHTIAVALKYDTEADVDLDVVCNAIKRIRLQVSSSESLAILSRIEGVVNCYRVSANIPGMMLINQNTPGDLLEDLLDDAKIISLSNSRFLLGIPGMFEIAMVRIKQGLREIMSDRRKMKYLSIASKVGNIATKQINVELPELEVETKKMFGPPLISLENIKPNCLKTGRILPENKPAIDE